MMNKSKLMLWNNQQLMKLKDIKLLTPQGNRKMINMAHQIHKQKEILTQLKQLKNQQIMWLRNPTQLLPPTKKILTQKTNQINEKHPKKYLIPPKIIKMTQLTKQKNQGLFQSLIYLIKVPK